MKFESRGVFFRKDVLFCLTRPDSLSHKKITIEVAMSEKEMDSERKREKRWEKSPTEFLS